VFKRFMRSKAVQIALGWLVAAYMVLVKYTTRWTIERQDKAQPVIDSGSGLIALTWHSRFMMLNSAWKKDWQMPHVLISRSRDGAIVAHATHFLGLKTIRGSAKKAGSLKAKGGAKAGHDIITALESGGCIVITPHTTVQLCCKKPQTAQELGPIYSASSLWHRPYHLGYTCDGASKCR